MSFSFGGGTNSGFGAFGASNPTSGFGAAAQPAAASPFGGGAASTFGAAPSAFGANSGATSAFGAPKPAATGFGGFGAAPTSTFGAQPAATGFGSFGTGTTTGTSGFGAAATPSTGFGAPTTTSSGFGTGTSGFGGFGAPAAGTGSAFGSTAAASPFGPKPTASASPFGSTSVFGGGAAQPATSAFGSGATSGFGSGASAFGSTTPSPSTGSVFGGGGGVSFGSAAKSPFGSTTTTSTFGAPASTGFGSSAFGAAPSAMGGAPQVGTGNPPYQPTHEAEPTGTGTGNYITISKMPAYSHKSVEELRYEDYLKRTDPAAATAVAALHAPAVASNVTGAGAFGSAPSAFGTAASQPATSSAFGSTGGFGSTTSAFGSTSTTSAFGAPSTGGFGATTPGTTSAFGGFGAQPAAGGSLFGGAARPASGFGTPAVSQPMSGGFGAPATSAFGATTGTATGGFGSAGGFGSSFGTTPISQPQSGFGFGATTAPATGGGFGTSSAFGKPATSSGFGGFGSTSAAAPATSSFSSFGSQPTTSTSLFGSNPAGATGGSSFSFGATAPKPATSAGFNFGGSGSTGGFGTSTGSAFGPTGTSAFGTATSQPLGSTSLFGSTPAAGTSTGGFSFGGTSAPAAGGSSLFGAKPAGSSLFGSTTTAPTGSLFGSTSTGSPSLFGAPAGTATTGSTGFGLGGSSFGSTGGGFGGFGSTGTATATPQLGFGSSAGSLFGATQPQAQAAPAQSQNLVAAPDVNPYGAGSFGAGLVEQNVNAALGLQTIKTGSSASRLNSFTDDIGLPRGPMESSLSTRRQLVTGRSSVPVSFIRSTFKGSKNRFSSFSTGPLASGSGSILRSGSDSGTTQDDEFKFSSSLFRNSVAKKLVIDKTEQSRTDPSSRGTGSRASVIPYVEDDDRSDVNDVSSNSTRNRALKPDYDGNYPVLFRNLTNRKSFTLRLHGHSTIKNARNEVKQVLRSTTSKNAISDIELVWKGRIVQDSLTVEDLRLKEGDIVDVVVIEDHEQEEKKSEGDASHSSLLKKKQDSKTSEETSKAGKRFMSYDDFLAAAIREEDGATSQGASPRNRAPSSSSCPVLKNENYYTVPSYDSLQRLTDSELSQLEGFTVGCKGLGSVQWIGKTDVRHLNLDELVFFEKKEVIVYKDDDHKHELGTGLNKPAIVELLGIFPPRKSTSADAYKEKVKQRTNDIGATFLDYSAANGIWRFRVEHFSRYGFDDDDDDDDDDEHAEGDVDMDNENGTGSAGTKGEVKMATVGRPFASLPSNAIFSSERAGILRKSAMCGSNAGVSNPKAVASFWNPDGLPSPSDEGYPTRADSSSIVEHAGESSFDLGFDEPEALAVPLKTSEVFPVDSALPLKPLGVDNDTMSALKGSKSTTYQMMLQVSGPKSTVVRNHVDAGMFMARSFRCSWGPNGELVNIGKLLSARNERFKERVAHRVCIEFPLKVSEEKKSLVKQGLELHYECSNRWRISGESKGLDFLAGEGTAAPSVCPSEYSLPSDDNLVRCLHKYVDYADTMVNKNPRSSFYQNSALLWRLVQALWGQEYGAAGSAGEFSRFYPLAARDDINESENLETFQTVDLRREAVSKWFEETLLSIYASGEATGEAESPSHGGVLRLICQHRIAEAAEMAMECGDFRLSTLISQALTYEGSDFRSLLLNQLSQWNEDGTIEYMEPELVLVYSLLAGSVEVFTAKEGKNMPWVVCLALFFWFNRGPATSLKSAVSAYMDAVTKSMASAPVSRFAEKKDDLLMEVMKLYIGDAVSLCNVLSPSGFMGGRFYHLDYELSWHLHSVLRAIGYKIDRKWESHIHQNFIRQLESMGMWEEAAYVALNISSPSERVDTCRGILFRNVDMLLGDAAKRESLCARLNIPPEWVSEALAIQAVSKNEYHEQIAHWMAAHRYEEAHLCLVTHVAPSCLFTGEKDMLFQLLSELEGGAMAISQWQSCVSGYAIGGGLLLEYLRLEKQDGLEVGREEEYLQRVLALSQQLSSIRDSSASNEKFDTIVKNEKLVARTSLASMIVSLATQAVQLQKILSYTQEQQGFSSPSNEAPLELRPEFLGNLSSLITGRETKFVESYRTTQLLNLCSTFLDWRSY